MSSVVEFLRKFSFDGLDMDWEYPTFRGGSKDDKENYILLLKELKEAFAQDNFLLTAAIGASKEKLDGSYDVVNMYKYLDYVNVMCYDYHGQWDGFTGHNAPLGPRPDETEGQRTLNVNFTINYLLEKGGDPKKTVLGVPLYGRTFLLKDADNFKMGAPTLDKSFQGPYTREDGFFGYNEICEQLVKSNSQWSVLWEPCHKVNITVKYFVRIF